MVMILSCLEILTMISITTTNNKVKDPIILTSHLLRRFNRNNDSLSMLHLNIRSIPDHILQLTSLLNNLNILVENNCHL